MGGRTENTYCGANKSKSAHRIGPWGRSRWRILFDPLCVVNEHRVEDGLLLEQALTGLRGSELQGIGMEERRSTYDLVATLFLRGTDVRGVKYLV